MTPFEAVFHGFTTAASGGFGTEADSLAGFSAYTQWVVIFLMFLTGVSFVLHYRALRDPKEYWRSTEFRSYTAIVLVAGDHHRGRIVVGHSRGRRCRPQRPLCGTGFGDDHRFRHPGLGEVGGVAADPGRGPDVLRSDGGFDVRRCQDLPFRDPAAFVRGRPQASSLPERRPDPSLREALDSPEIVDNVQSFFLFYMMAFVGGTFLLALAEAVLGAGTDLVTAASAVASALGNIGPALGDVGPTGTYAAVTAPGKWLLTFLMILGRLEIFPLLLLFTRHLWRR